MYVIIIFDPDTCEFKEVVGPFKLEDDAGVFTWMHGIKDFIIAELKSPTP